VRVDVLPGSRVAGSATVPGDKSIAHRLLILAATARGSTSLRGVPAALDVLQTARVLAAVAPSAAPGLAPWSTRSLVQGETDSMERGSPSTELRLEGAGRGGLIEPDRALDCGNSGTTLRLMAGILAARDLRAELTGDASLRRRPMERMAEPLRAMGAEVGTTDGRPPVRIRGGPLRGIAWSTPVPSAQVKGTILLAGLAAGGATQVTEPAATRDHTERALEALGAPVERSDRSVTVRAFQHDGFEADLPGDVSSAAFLFGAAAIGGSDLAVSSVGLNPTRLTFLEVFERMGIRSATEMERESLGEPHGRIRVLGGSTLRGTVVPSAELPLVVDEVPLLAAIAAHADGETRFEGASELRFKESDRLTALAEGIRELGGEAEVEGDALVVAGGGLAGGAASARGDHRLAMALVVAALGARGPCSVEGIECAAVSFPGFVRVVASLGARAEVT
jgi:3-phosphoshikimate 1-carboxyvinyltransferase